MQKSREIFLNKNTQAFEHKILNCQDEGKKLVEIIFEINATASKSDAKRLIEGKAVKVNDKLYNITIYYIIWNIIMVVLIIT